MTDERESRDRSRSMSPTTIARAIADEQARASSPGSKVLASVLASVVAGVLLALLGSVGNYFVMRAQLNTVERDLERHVALDGHTSLVLRVVHLEGRLEGYQSARSERDQAMDARLTSIETNVGQMRESLDRVLAVRPRRGGTR